MGEEEGEEQKRWMKPVWPCAECICLCMQKKVKVVVICKNFFILFCYYNFVYGLIYIAIVLSFVVNKFFETVFVSSFCAINILVRFFLNKI